MSQNAIVLNRGSSKSERNIFYKQTLVHACLCSAELVGAMGNPMDGVGTLDERTNLQKRHRYRKVSPFRLAYALRSPELDELDFGTFFG